MIVVDTSIIVAIYLGEPDSFNLAKLIVDDGEAAISAASVLECSVVIRSRKIAPATKAEHWLDQVLETFPIKVQPVDVVQSRLARDAHRQYGKGTGHPAQLNFGDCFAYALAKSLDVPLLFKGSDFSRTDIKPALIA